MDRDVDTDGEIRGTMNRVQQCCFKWMSVTSARYGLIFLVGIPMVIAIPLACSGSSIIVATENGWPRRLMSLCCSVSAILILLIGFCRYITLLSNLQAIPDPVKSTALRYSKFAQHVNVFCAIALVCFAATRGVFNLWVDACFLLGALILAAAYCSIQSIIDHSLGNANGFQSFLCINVLAGAFGATVCLVAGSGCCMCSAYQWVTVSAWLAYLNVWLLSGPHACYVDLKLSIHNEARNIELEQAMALESHSSYDVSSRSTGSEREVVEQIVVFTFSRRLVSAAVFTLAVWPLIFLVFAYILSLWMGKINGNNLLLSGAISSGVPHSIGIIGMTVWALSILVVCAFRSSNAYSHALERQPSPMTCLGPTKSLVTWHVRFASWTSIMCSCGLLVCGNIEDVFSRPVHVAFSCIAFLFGIVVTFQLWLLQYLVQRPDALNTSQRCWSCIRCGTWVALFLTVPAMFYKLLQQDWTWLGIFELIAVALMSQSSAMLLLPRSVIQDDLCTVGYDVCIEVAR